MAAQILQDSADLQALIDCLDGRGLREGGLLASLLRIQPSLAAAPPGTSIM